MPLVIGTSLLMRKSEQGSINPKIGKPMKINTENCVFVGDQIDTDIIGAQNANIKPILIDRENLYSEYKDCVVINNLNELLDVINL